MYVQRVCPNLKKMLLLTSVAHTLKGLEIDASFVEDSSLIQIRLDNLFPFLVVVWMVAWLVDCQWLVLRETSVVWTMAICHSSVTERSPQPHYCRQAMPTFFPASAFTILLALLNC